MLYNGYAVQELHGSDADLNEVRGSRPEADDSTQLTAALCQTHPPAAPQVCLFVLFALVNHMVPHGVFWHAQWLMCKSHSDYCRSNVHSHWSQPKIAYMTLVHSMALKVSSSG